MSPGVIKTFSSSSSFPSTSTRIGKSSIPLSVRVLDEQPTIVFSCDDLKTAWTTDGRRNETARLDATGRRVAG
jgi:hypothetical protein